jgi:hypothetical protein
MRSRQRRDARKRGLVQARQLLLEMAVGDQFVQWGWLALRRHAGPNHECLEPPASVAVSHTQRQQQRVIATVPGDRRDRLLLDVKEPAAGAAHAT